MKFVFILFMPVLLAFSGCKKPSGKSESIQTTSVVSDSCPDFFYYYNQEKIPLELAPQYLLVGFKTQLKAEEKLKIMRQFPEFVQFYKESPPEDAAPFTIIELKPATTCPQNLSFTKKLDQQDLILYANPVFKAPSNLGSGHQWIGITSEFVVTLKSADQEPELKKQLALTQTELSENLGNNTFLLTATKNSKGNALEMANYFRGLDFAGNAEPNFFMAGRVSEIQDK